MQFVTRTAPGGTEMVELGQSRTDLVEHCSCGVIIPVQGVPWSELKGLRRAARPSKVRRFEVSTRAAELLPLHNDLPRDNDKRRTSCAVMYGLSSLPQAWLGFRVRQLASFNVSVLPTTWLITSANACERLKAGKGPGTLSRLSSDADQFYKMRPGSCSRFSGAFNESSSNDFVKEIRSP